MKSKLASKILGNFKLDTSTQFLKVFDVKNCQSWAEVELAQAISGADMTKNVIDFFVIGSAIQKNLFLTFIDGIKTSDEVVSRISNPEIFKLIYFLTTDNRLGREIKQELLEKWLNIYESVHDSPEQQILSLSWHLKQTLLCADNGIDLETTSPLLVADLLPELKYEVKTDYSEKIRKITVDAKHLLYNAIDSRAPFAMLKFYDKYKKAILTYDVWFMNFLLKRTKAKAEVNDVFKKIFVALEKDIQSLQKYSMYMN